MSSSGETDVFWDQNQEYIQNVINAMHEAIIKRG